MTAAPRAGLPLSFAQQRLWILDRMGVGAVSHIPLALRLRGRLDVASLARALNEVARRHESLRTGFVAIDGRPTQQIAATPDVRLVQEDLGVLEAAAREEAVEALAREDFERPFDLQRPPLLRATLLRLGEREHVLLLTVHHIVADGWSIGILHTELGQLLAAFTRGEPSPLPELALQYADSATGQRRELDAGAPDRARNYWRGQLDGLGTLDLATDRPRPLEPSYAGSSRLFTLGPALSAALRELARSRGVTLTTVLLAAWQALLSRLCGQEDVAVGLPVSNRPRVELEPIIGVFTNTLVVRTDLSGDPRIADDLLPRVRDVLVGGLEHQALPFEQLLVELNPPRDPSRHPLVQVLFSMGILARESQGFGDLEAEIFRTPAARTGFDLDLRISDQAGLLSGRLIYATDLFDEPSIERLVASFVCLAQGAVDDPGARLSELPLLDTAERALVVETWNSTSLALPDVTVVELVRAQAARTPEAPAVVHGGEALGYAELLVRARRLARHLRARGLGPGDLVGVAVDRGLSLVTALLAVWEAGAAWVPLDPGLPRARLAFMIEDSGLRALIASPGRADDLAGHGVLVVAPDAGRALDGEACAGPRPDDLAYVIYTSGSTGRPKGVAVGHRAVANALQALAREPGLRTQDVLLALASVSFDIAVAELFLPLVVGARVVLADERDAADGRTLALLIASSGATVVQATPTTWRLLLGAGWRGDPRLTLLCGGETLTRELARELLPCCGRLWNLYGPTEATIWALAQRVEDGSGPVPIGRPIANLQAYVLDPHAQPLPVGVVGELYLAGAGLARGYWRRPELTSQAFVPDPFHSGARLYRTGDRARWAAGGTLEFAGRADRQVKLRGHRIELGEIERVLSGHASVGACAVVVRDEQLVAHVVARAGSRPEDAELRAHLQAELPAFMVAQRFVLHDALPLSTSRKVDHARLVAHEDAGLGRASRGGPPRTHAEAWLAGLWRDLLEVETIGVDDNFFDLGGHSLLAMDLVHAVERQRGVSLEPRQLLRATLGQLAALCDAPRAAPAPGWLARIGQALSRPGHA